VCSFACGIHSADIVATQDSLCMSAELFAHVFCCVFHRLDMGENTFFLSLTFPDMAPQAELLSKLAAGTDAMELRVVSATTASLKVY
jgi:hypothetical protein